MKTRVIIRRCRFQPYLPGKGPTFALTMTDTGRLEGSRPVIGYRLTMSMDGKQTLLFLGEDFKPAPGLPIAGNTSVCDLMSFLTLRPGDTEREHFDDYTRAQLEYCDRWAEALSCEVDRRFGRDAC